MRVTHLLNKDDSTVCGEADPQMHAAYDRDYVTCKDCLEGRKQKAKPKPEDKASGE